VVSVIVILVNVNVSLDMKEKDVLELLVLMTVPVTDVVRTLRTFHSEPYLNITIPSPSLSKKLIPSVISTRTGMLKRLEDVYVILSGEKLIAPSVCACMAMILWTSVMI
jgi:hypothetical protein